MEKILTKINRARNAGFHYAFIADATWGEVAELRKHYEVIQGWNTPYLTGVNYMEFGYLIKLK